MCSDDAHADGAHRLQFLNCRIYIFSRGDFRFKRDVTPASQGHPGADACGGVPAAEAATGAATEMWPGGQLPRATRLQSKASMSCLLIRPHRARTLTAERVDAVALAMRRTNQRRTVNPLRAVNRGRQEVQVRPQPAPSPEQEPRPLGAAGGSLAAGGMATAFSPEPGACAAARDRARRVNEPKCV